MMSQQITKSKSENCVNYAKQRIPIVEKKFLSHQTSQCKITLETVIIADL